MDSEEAYEISSDGEEDVSDYEASPPPKKQPAKKKAPAKTKQTTLTGATSKKTGGSKQSSGDDEDDAMDGTGVDENGQSVEEIYQKKTPIEHILLRPDTYVGSTEHVTQDMWVFDDESKKMEYRKITFIPGLYKIFDEIIVNAYDNKQRDKTMNTLKVDISSEDNRISVWNNGSGIPVVMHKEHKVYVPELIFGNLLTGSNFNDKQKKTTGGRNGYGAKLANIFSTEFTVETADKSNQLKYKQVFTDNMGKINKPKITSWSKKDYTCISFKPDLERFQMDKLDRDIIALFKKRVYDIAGVSDKSLKVYLNGELVPVRTFAEYVKMYPSPSGTKSGDASNSEPEVFFDKPGERWQVGVALSDDSFQQISFVNGICTTKGGQHVNYITDQITAKLSAAVKKKNDGVKPSYIKNHLMVYVNALIENPAFDSQTKETLTTRPNSFGSTYTLSDGFMKKIAKSGIVDRILSFAEFKQTAALRRKGGSSGRKVKLLGIPKLDDANWAGTAKGKECTLILTEGDSAKSTAVGGLAVVGRDKYGVFPLRGKLLNVREASHKQIMENAEIQNLIKILGLRVGETYDNTKSLRYGHLMVMTDQDHDGSHIKGLVINFIHHFWPSLLRIEGFLQEFITPIVKCTKGTQKKVFFTMPEYEAWRESTNHGRGWKIKYYKGLGTSSNAEAKEYFSDLGKHQIDFVYGEEADGDSIDMAFSKKRVEERKDWLRGYTLGDHIDHDVSEIPYADFVNKELILFSMADNLRSIPSVVDGFKPSQRKVLYACFKRNLKVEIKVAQLAGYVAEHTAYHHGENSLHATIVNMAQDFVGSNNIHLLSPNGQFGTRLMGGRDAASPRYIFTNLEQLSRCIFDPLDNDILNHLQEDGETIEPEWFMPVIPMALVNGNEGIGTGWSCTIPNYNPLDLIANLRKKLKGEEMEELVPWYRGFSGQIFAKPTNNRDGGKTFVVQGTYEEPDESTLVITELPIRTWTQPYKTFLESLVEKEVVKEFKENHTESKVLFTLTLDPNRLKSIREAPGGIIKQFKLETTLSTSNMHMFDHEGQIQKYKNPHEVIDEFYDLRLDFYAKRKESMLSKLAFQIKLLSNKARFVLAVVEGQMIVSNRKREDILQQLLDEGYDQIKSQASSKKEESESSDDETDVGEAAKGYDYLLSLKIWSLTKERVDKLKSEVEERRREYAELDATAVDSLWLNDLEKLEQMIVETEETRVEMQSKVQKVRPKKTKRKKDGEDSDYEERPKKRRAPAKPKSPAKPKTAAKPKMTAKPKPPAAPKTKSSIANFFEAKPKEEAKEELKEEPMKESSEEEVENLSLAERLAKRPSNTPKKAPANGAKANGTKANGSKSQAKPKSKPASKKQESGSEEEVEEVAPIAPRRAGRAKKPVVYTDLVSDEDDGGHSSEFEEMEDGDDSDFE